jgi:superfamily II DNA/RNA helicase
VPTQLTDILARDGVTKPLPIQQATLPSALAGRDVLGRARTGSGKTYAFVLPLLSRLAASPSRRSPKRPRALILVPTRELATQIDGVLRPLAHALSLRSTTVFGGVSSHRQVDQLRAGVDIVVACPGRLDDHVRHRHVDLSAVEITVIDEADHLTNLGFLPVVRRLLDQTPRRGQRLLFSATLDADVEVLTRDYLDRPMKHNIDESPADPHASSHHVLHGQAEDQFPVLLELAAVRERSIVFTRTKRRAKALTKRLVAAGVPAVELHGNLAQGARDRNLHAFSAGAARTLVATDIAARGIHIEDVRLVIHADPPAEHKAYLHRSGRTARAGNTGTVVSLATDAQLSDVQQLARKAGIAVTTTRVHAGHPLLAELAPGDRPLHRAVARPTPSPTSSPQRRRQPTEASVSRSGPKPAETSTTAAGVSAAAFSARSRAGAPRR